MNNIVIAYLVVFGGMPAAGIAAGWFGRGVWERCRPNRIPPPGDAAAEWAAIMRAVEGEREGK